MPTDEAAQESYKNSAQMASNGTSSIESQDLLLRICDSEWSTLSFDLTRLQQEPIKIKDVQRKEG